ncbi:MAG: GHMP family kinase ATP-binding protein [Candidatus Oleimicrobiaceae bacterium]
MLGKPKAPLEVKAFLETMKRSFGGIFAPRRDIVIVRAPARLELMGGLTTAFGAVVLQTTLSDALVVGVQRRTDRRILVRSTGVEEYGLASTIELDLDRVLNLPQKQGALHGIFAKEPQGEWAAAIAAVFQELVASRVVSGFETGVNIGIQSSIPVGTALASSTALVCAAALGIIRLFSLEMPTIEIPSLCYRAEKRVRGAEVSIADHLTVCLCSAHEVLAIRCQPGEIIKRVPVPKEARFVGLNTMIGRQEDQRYLETKVAACMGTKIIVKHLRKTERHPQTFGGYLCNIPMTDFATYRRLLPAKITGKQFRTAHGTLQDYGLTICSSTTYRVRSCTEHLVMEHRRAEQMLALLTDAEGEVDEWMTRVGRLMYDSHESSRRDCNLSNQEADLLVNLVKERGPKHGLYGARATGRRSGGTVAVAAVMDSDYELRNVLAQYHDTTGIQGRLHTGSSAGALLGSITTAQFS